MRHRIPEPPTRITLMAMIAIILCAPHVWILSARILRTRQNRLMLAVMLYMSLATALIIGPAIEIIKFTIRAAGY